MAGRTKKDATKSLAQLQQYLRHDRDGTRMLIAVRTYVSELRAIQARLKTEEELARAQVDGANTRRCEMSHEVAELAVQVEREQAKCRQLRSELLRAEATIARLEAASVEDEDDDDDVEPLDPAVIAAAAVMDPVLSPTEATAAIMARAVIDTPKICTPALLARAVKRLRRRLLKPPDCLTYLRKGHLAVFDPTQIVREHTDEEYARLGLFTMVVNMIDLPVGFRFRYAPWTKAKPCPEDSRFKFLNWSKSSFSHAQEFDE